MLLDLHRRVHNVADSKGSLSIFAVRFAEISGHHKRLGLHHRVDKLADSKGCRSRSDHTWKLGGQENSRPLIELGGGKMDMTLPALKLFVAELQDRQVRVEESTGHNVVSIGGLTFQRVWLQGILVTPLEHGTMVLDDGSAVIELFLTKAQQAQRWEPGMYVLINGRFHRDAVPFVEVHKIVDLTSQPVTEAAWHLEVAEVHEKFYDHLIANVQ